MVCVPFVRGTLKGDMAGMALRDIARLLDGSLSPLGAIVVHRGDTFAPIQAVVPRSSSVMTTVMTTTSLCTFKSF